MPDVFFKDPNVQERVWTPTNAMWCDEDDTLLWKLWSFVGDQPCTLSARIMRVDGTVIPVFQQLGSGSSAITPNQKQLPLVAGFILSITVTCRAVASGEVWTTVELQRGLGSGDATLGTLLVAGYPGAFNDTSYPTMQPQPADSGYGAITNISVANPAAGADWTFTLPSGFHIEIIGVRAIYTASAAVASRLPRIFMRDPANIAADIPAAAVVTASQAAILNWHAGNTIQALAAPVVIQSMGFPVDSRLYAGFSIGSTTAGIQAGDQWSAIVLQAALWFGL